MNLPLGASALLLLGSVAFAQSDATSKVHPITTQVKDGGTYHAATRTWTRKANPTANLTGEVLYDNTCTVGFFGGMSATESAVDSGRLPSTSSPGNSVSVVGNDDAYVVDGFRIAYCTSENSVDLIVAHYECYGTVLCQDQTLNATLVSALGIGGAPASALSGSLSCWGIIIDLRNSTLEFTMAADCDGAYLAPDINNAFAWEFFEVAGGINGLAGPLLAGDPFGLLTGTPCPYAAGTKFSATPGPGTGLGTQDAFTTYIPGPAFSGGVFAGCWFYGGYTSGNLYASFFHQMSGEKSGGSSSAITEFCNGDGSGTPCPCGNSNNGSNGVAGCANSAGAGGGKLSWTGTNSILADDLVLHGSALQPGQAGLYLQGNNAIAGGNGQQFGDGLRCAGGGVARLQIRNSGMVGASFTTVSISAVGGVVAGDIKRYQLWFRDTAGPCGSGFNFTNGLEIVWVLDADPRPRCDNCHAVDATVEECHHFANDPEGAACRKTQCIINRMVTASCDRHPNRSGPPNCDTAADTGPKIVQTVRTPPAPLTDCPATVAWANWDVSRTYYGCNANCFQKSPLFAVWRIACEIPNGTCMGALVGTFDRGAKKKCGC